MKTIALAYHLPDAYAERLNLRSVNFRLSVTNPFLIYSDKRLKGQDPEYYRSGGVSLPTPKQCTLSMNVTF